MPLFDSSVRPSRVSPLWSKPDDDLRNAATSTTRVSRRANLSLVRSQGIAGQGDPAKRMVNDLADDRVAWPASSVRDGEKDDGSTRVRRERFRRPSGWGSRDDSCAGPGEQCSIVPERTNKLDLTGLRSIESDSAIGVRATHPGSDEVFEMAAYFVNRNAQPNGDHEVHVSGCPHMPEPENCLPLGDFDDCRPAVAKAKRIYPSADGCYNCCNPCHMR